MKKIESQEANASQEAPLMPAAWVKALLSTEFYNNCPKHPRSKHKECNMFCINCRNDAFCGHCHTSLHSGHLVLQIRRSSYENAVSVMEVEKVLDVKGIQTYVINKGRVVYLNRREQRSKPPISIANLSPKCVICHRSLMMDNSLFCSLNCKFEGVTKVGNPSPVGTNNDEGSKEGETREKRQSTNKLNIKNHEFPPSNSRKRRGVPHRAPLSGHLVGIL